MTLDEAIMDLSIQLEVKHRLGKDYQANAIELGIEALKRLKEYREWHRSTADGPLPGETKE